MCRLNRGETSPLFGLSLSLLSRRLFAFTLRTLGSFGPQASQLNLLGIVGFPLGNSFCDLRRGGFHRQRPARPELLPIVIRRVLCRNLLQALLHGFDGECLPFLERLRSGTVKFDNRGLMLGDAFFVAVLPFGERLTHFLLERLQFVPNPRSLRVNRF